MQNQSRPKFSGFLMAAATLNIWRIWYFLHNPANRRSDKHTSESSLAANKTQLFCTECKILWIFCTSSIWPCLRMGGRHACTCPCGVGVHAVRMLECSSTDTSGTIEAKWAKGHWFKYPLRSITTRCESSRFGTEPKTEGKGSAALLMKQMKPLRGASEPEARKRANHWIS